MRDDDTVPALDHGMLEELREDLGDDFPAFVQRFIDTASRAMDTLATAIAAREGAAVAEHAHGLKGTAGYVGALAFAERLGAMQAAAEAGDLAAAARTFDEVRDAFARTVPLLRP